MLAKEKEMFLSHSVRSFIACILQVANLPVDQLQRVMLRVLQ
jgi:hypothetical protein